MSRAERKTISALYKDFEKAHAAYRAIPGEEDGKHYDRAVEKACRLAARIAITPAVDVAEMLLKIRVAIWDIGDMKYDRLEDLDRWKPTRLSQEIFHASLASLRDDLARVSPLVAVA